MSSKSETFHCLTLLLPGHDFELDALKHIICDSKLLLKYKWFLCNFHISQKCVCGKVPQLIPYHILQCCRVN